MNTPSLIEADKWPCFSFHPLKENILSDGHEMNTFEKKDNLHNNRNQRNMFKVVAMGRIFIFFF